MSDMMEAGLRKMFNRGKERPMITDMPRDVVVPMPQQEPPPASPSPEYQRPSLYADGEEEEIMMQAAAAHKRTVRVIEDLKTQLTEAQANCWAKDNAIGELQLLIAQERNYVASLRAESEDMLRTYRAECDQAKQDRSDLVALFGNIFAILERFELPVPIKRGRRGRSAAVVADGNGNSGDREAALSDTGEGGEAVAGEPLILENRKTVLDR